MNAITIAALSILMALPAQAGERNRHSGPLVSICDNDGHCTTSKVVSVVAKANKRRISAASTATNAPGSTVTTPESTVEVTTSKATKIALDANGNKTPGAVVSTKTGARARVGVAYAARFQAYIDDLENNHGARVLFMAGIRPGRCLPESQHPCGKALDVCQVGWGKVDPRCNLPDRATLGRIAAAHGLFEGGRWCHSDYGHVQTSVTAAACGEDPFRVVRRTTLEAARARP
jgi:D-alanyl-D-alanine carboxypeptidase